MEEIHFKILTYKLLECDDEHFLFLDKHDVEESCTVYSLIFMLEMLKKKGEDHTYCYAFSFEYHLLHFKTFKSLLH